ncbi:MAG: threonylcarbamoyl-AMP synthase [Treponema sp.]|jgi:L-threonylcarbamoyladenylate synthase|nr:threonylcarbamoyl-AMP synthase [Treponema sp.]
MRSLKADDAAVRFAAEILSKGGLVAFPTETVYGLGGDALNPSALARIFEAKGRPRFDPLIIHIAGLETLEEIADLGPLDSRARLRLETLTAHLWPGPLTLVLPKQTRISGLATGGLPTVAIRFPAHPVAQALIRLSSGAVAAPSANRFGCLSPTRAEHVLEQLDGKIDLILDGGRSPVGVESTVLDLSSDPPRLLRPGGVSRERLEALIGPVCAGDGSSPRSPGQLTSHYAPRAPLSLYAGKALAALDDNPREGFLFFCSSTCNAWLEGLRARGGNLPALPVPRIRTLSSRGDPCEAAANLFDTLYALDGLGLTHIRAEAAPEESLGPAINDRLFRAQGAL